MTEDGRDPDAATGPAVSEATETTARAESASRECESSSTKKDIEHKLRTPIHQIIGYSEMLAEEAESEGQEQFLPDLERIGTAARRLLSAIDGLDLDSPTATPAAPEVRARPEAKAIEVRSGNNVAPAMHGGTSSSDEPAKLLVVDDIEMNRSMLSHRLERRGFEVDLAGGGKEAIDKIKTGSYDLVLLDITMPEVSGYDVLQEVRKDHSEAELPIIMATVKDQGEDLVSAFEMGANDYITKPIDFAVALVRVQTQLSRKRAMEESNRLTLELERHNQFIRKTFGRYLSKGVVESLLSKPEGLQLGGEKRALTILMSDLRGFSALSEKLDPERVVKMLNNYLGIMAEVVAKYDGTIDEFIGDAILALFGAPVRREDDARRAVSCAIEMQLAMREVNEENRKLGLPELEMGIAVNSGECVVGTIGSQKRAKYGVVGSHVNLTGRIESYTVGGQVLISESTAAALGDQAVLGEELKLGMKGFKEPVIVYELLSIEGDAKLALPERTEELRALVRELLIHIDLMEGKHLTEESHRARLAALSMSEARVELEDPNAGLKKLANVRVRFTGLNGVIIPGHLYAKVTATEESLWTLRFTSVPEEVKSFLRSTLANEVE